MKTYPLPALLHLWWHCKNSVGAMETCRTAPQERRHRITMAMSLLERMESRALKRDVHIHILHSTTQQQRKCGSNPHSHRPMHAWTKWVRYTQCSIIWP